MNKTFVNQPFNKAILFAFFLVFNFGLQAKTIKVLAIGNSFSEDAVENYLHSIAAAAGDTMIIGNMYIGGCSLERHWNNAEGDSALYAYRKIDVTGKMTETKGKRLSEAIPDEDWDFISLQQVSQNSGIYKTYFPYIEKLIGYVRSLATNPNMRFVLHQTWAYATTSTHSGFANYGRNQQKMYKAITKTYKRVASKTGIGIIIPAGTAIQNGRTSAIGDNFCRDGYHLDLKVGRFTAACTWYEKLSGHTVVGNTCAPEGISPENIHIAQQSAHLAVLKPSRITKIH